MRLIDADALKETLRKLPRWIVRKDNSHNEGFTYDQVFFAIDAQPEPIRPKAKDVCHEEADHCEFKCSLCHATIGVVEGGTLDGAWFRFCPNCGAEMEDWCERPD